MAQRQSTPDLRAGPTTRLTRGLDLFMERGTELERVGTETYRVPSGTNGTAVYTVRIAPVAFCSCDDHRSNDDPDLDPDGFVCKHVAAAVIFAAFLRVRDRGTSRRECAGCSGLFDPKSLIELHEGTHDALTHFDGDLVCRGCARRDGVSW